jgi:hypothetical protein
MVTFERSTGVPADRVVNTWAVNQFDAGDSALLRPSITDAFAAFYNDIPPGRPDAVGHHISPNVSRVADQMSVRLYEIPAVPGPMGSPYFFKNYTLRNSFEGAAGTPLPDDVAIVLSLEAAGHDTAPVEIGPIRPRSRFKGRVYVGPLNTASGASAGGFFRPSSGFINTTLAATTALQAALAAVLPAVDLGVWSRKDANVRAVQAASIDNEFDTQRRRGTKPTARTRVLL